MAKLLMRIKNRARLLTQICFAALTNGYITGFKDGKIFTGDTKALCVPGLNCYSCPGALGSCPIGALQSVLGSRKYKMSFYIVGFLIFVGAVFGRFICGWLCPFGLVQDLIYKIPFFKKVKNLPGHKFLVWIKYFILIVFVILLPLFAVDIIGQGKPWFCQYICPSGTLMAGIPLVLQNEILRGAIGFLYTWKIAILIFIIILSIMVYRPFCKYICPLGAIYGLFNSVSIYRYGVDKEKCVSCGKCKKVCKMDIDASKTPNCRECIRCGDCIKNCPTEALYRERMKKK